MMHLPLVKCTASSASCFFLFGHSSKSKHLFSGRIGIISILNSLRVETLLIGSTCPSMSQLFPSASIISWKSWSFSASVESTNWPEGCNELHHHSESLRVSELINPNLKNEHGLMFSEQTKRPHGKPPGVVYSQIQDIRVHFQESMTQTSELPCCKSLTGSPAKRCGKVLDIQDYHV